MVPSSPPSTQGLLVSYISSRQLRTYVGINLLVMLRVTQNHPPPRKSISIPQFNFTYSVNDVLGRGFSSQVYRGRSNITGFPLAVKIINSSLLKEMDKKLIMSEIASMRKVRGKSPYVLNLVEVSEMGTNVFIVTEQCDYDLTRVLQEGGMIERRAVSIMEEVIRGFLCVAHNGVVHRDIKPANIFMKNNHVKIGDFGFAISVEECKTCHNVGSPLYMSPQALQNTQYSFASDIWSLGVIYFQMLFGAVPWNAENQACLLQRILSVPIADILQDKVISQNSELFLKKTLNPNPSLRMTLGQLEQFTLRSLRPVSSLVYQRAQIRKQPAKKVPTAINDVDKSELSQALICQLMLCEYFLQLLEHLSYIGQDNKTLISKVFHKFIRVKSSQIRQCDTGSSKLPCVGQFRSTAEFSLILKNLQAFQTRVKKLFGSQDVSPQPGINHKEVKQQIMNLITGLFLGPSAKSQTNPVSNVDRKFILDSLVCAYELIRAVSTNDIISFSKTSNVQQSLQQLRARPVQTNSVPN